MTHVYRGVSAHPVAAAPPMAVTDDETDRVARLFDTHQDMLYRLARRLTESADDARPELSPDALRSDVKIYTIDPGR